MINILKLILILSFLRCYMTEPQLKLLNVVLRHGDRTPTDYGLYLTNWLHDSDFFPYGKGALTNDGKQRSYQLGEYLRKRYKDFLGETYLPEILYARSTDFDRTKMSLQLILAALFPPRNIQKWHNTLNWQPIPIKSVELYNDDLLAAVYHNKFHFERERVQMKEDIQERLEYLRKFITKLSSLTGRNINDTLHMKTIYETLKAENNMNLTLPDWVNDEFPHGKLLEGILFDYSIITYDDSIISSYGGKLISKITTDMLATRNDTSTKTKLFLYSCHETNIVATLASLNIFDLHVPEYSSAVIIELLEEDNKYFVKVLYYRGYPTDVIELNIPECPHVCPIENYLNIIQGLLSIVKSAE